MTPSPVGMRCPECAGDRTEVRRPAFAGQAGAPRATVVLIAVNVLFFVVQVLTGDSSGGGPGLFADGALCGNAVGDGGRCIGGGIILTTEGGEWWRIVSGGFLHGGIIHLALNMFVLYILGQVLEPAIGTARFVALYLVSLLAGSFGALLLSGETTFTVGASGAIYGLFIATILIARQRGNDQVVAQLGFWLALNLVLTFSISTISVGGHLGGLVGGVIGTLLVIGAERRIARRETLPAELAVMAALGVGIAIGAIAIATAGINFQI
jgi:membrane associated rhomboid family serine protease